uniref:RING-type domain-containing protein n=1 Tax=Kalanchoe fedtschenkoi TaxID=63787 RepID=A0A7N0U1H5_KALFE
MGLCQFSSQAEGVLPVVVLNAILSVIALRDSVKSLLRSAGVLAENSSGGEECRDLAAERRVMISRFGSKDGDEEEEEMVECCSVCLCGFERGEVVSELPCKHFFHRGCLEKWVCNNNGGSATCPLCRSLI